MTIGESFKIAISKAFKNTLFPKKDAESVKALLSTKVHGSDVVTILPPLGEVKIKDIDNEHSELSIIYEDYQVIGIITWRPNTNGFAFVNIE